MYNKNNIKAGTQSLVNKYVTHFMFLYSTFKYYLVGLLPGMYSLKSQMSFYLIQNIVLLNFAQQCFNYNLE